MTRNQIVYLLLTKRYRNSITKIEKYHGADVQSDYNPLVANHQHNAETGKQVSAPKTRLQNEERNNKKRGNRETKEVTMYWKDIRVEEERLNPDHIMKKSWTTEEILQSMIKKSSYKNRSVEYKIVQRKIKKKQGTSGKMSRIEICQKKGDIYLHKMVNEMIGTRKEEALFPQNEEKTVAKEDGNKTTIEELHSTTCL